MKFELCAAAALLLASAAHAQASCDQVNQIVVVASDGFKAVRGGEIGHELYNGTLNPSGFACTIRIDVDDTYRCGWKMELRASLEATYEKQVSIVRTCLSGWIVSTHRFGDDDPDPPRIVVDGVNVNGRRVAKGVSIRFQRTVRGDTILVFVGRNEIVEAGQDNMFDLRLTIMKEGK